MGAFGVVKADESNDFTPCLLHIFIRLQLDFLIFDGAP